MPRYLFDTSIGVDNTTARALDLSGNSVLFETAHPFAPGDEIELVLPLAHIGPSSCVTCKAQVVRVEPRGDLFAVAVVYELVGFNVASA